jgi:hypothetical protein
VNVQAGAGPLGANRANDRILPQPLNLGHGAGSFFAFSLLCQILSLTDAFLDSVGKDQEARRHLGVLLLLPALYAQLIPQETERSTT